MVVIHEVAMYNVYVWCLYGFHVIVKEISDFDNEYDQNSNITISRKILPVIETKL